MHYTYHKQEWMQWENSFQVNFWDKVSVRNEKFIEGSDISPAKALLSLRDPKIDGKKENSLPSCKVNEGTSDRSEEGSIEPLKLNYNSLSKK